ncbi:hypothetical protein BGZ65_002122, partial [Modicella reniformis]
MVWKSPRVLWSRHWSRFFPVCVTKKDAETLYLSETTRASTAIRDDDGDDDDDDDTHDDMEDDGEIKE